MSQYTIPCGRFFGPYWSATDPSKQPSLCVSKDNLCPTCQVVQGLHAAARTGLGYVPYRDERQEVVEAARKQIQAALARVKMDDRLLEELEKPR